MKILFATSESAPFIRTGGLGDVSGALPRALSNENEDVRVILPLYGDIPDTFKQTMAFIGSTTVQLSWRQQYAGVFKQVYNNVTYYFIDNEYYFKRKSLYGHFDDGERFAFFSRAVLQVLPLIDFYPDVLHCNDWQTGLIPAMLDAFYREIEGYKFIKTVLTIHNIEFQGSVDKYCIRDIFGMPKEFDQVVEYAGSANMLKAGIERANIVTTVSKTYAKELMSPYFACGLENILSERSFKLRGIVNGIDTTLYNPATDPALFKNYTGKTIAKKVENKLGLQELVNLPKTKEKPLIGMVTRLTNQKGLDILMEVIEQILAMDIQMVILGTGDWRYEHALTELAGRYINKLAVIINFSADLASKIYAGCDMFLMPSRFEPCGLSQLIAMRYGTVPIVREIGGLKDTVESYNPLEKTGTGFTFQSYNAYDMLDSIYRAVREYEEPESWIQVVKNAMSRDSGWSASAKQYIALYKEIIG